MARTLALSGFSLPCTVLPPQTDNPEGFWESVNIVNLNDELLAMRDASWHDMFAPDEAPLLSRSGSAVMARAVTLLGSEFDGAPRIVLKDPRISILAGFWRTALEGAGYECAFVLMVRNPAEVAASLARRDGFSNERGLLIWLTNMLAAERKSRGSRRLFVTYEGLLEDPHSVLDEIETTLGEALPRRTRASDLEVERALKGDLRHHTAAGPLPLRGELRKMVTETYAWFTQSAKGETPDGSVLDNVSRRLSRCEEVVGGVLAEMRLSLGAIIQNHQISQAQLGLCRVEADAERLRSASLQAANDATALRAEALEEQLRVERLTSSQSAAEWAGASEMLQAKVGEVAKALGDEKTRSVIEVGEALRRQVNAENESQALSELLADRDVTVEDERQRSLMLRQEISRLEVEGVKMRNANAIQEAHNATSLDNEREKAAALLDALEQSRRHTLEREAELMATVDELTANLERERRQAEGSQAKGLELAKRMNYIQSRPWWRILTILKSALRSFPTIG